MEEYLPGDDLLPFRDERQAKRNLNRVEPMLPPGGLSILKLFLRQSPNPDAALSGLDRFLGEAGQPAEELFHPASMLGAAIAIFSQSRYLTEALIRHPQLLGWALDAERIYRVLPRDELRSELGWLGLSEKSENAATTLARFKRMHVLRIALRDLLGIATLAEVTEELSNLADALLRGAQEYVQQGLVSRFGRPLAEADSGPIECQFVVLALGKLGGRELNYSSDIDLIFLYTGEGQTSGPIRISNAEFAAQLANQFTNLLSRMTPEGSCYRVDLRLRPDGRMGEVVLTVGSAAEYYHQRARDWELQMLIKARPVAGSRRLGRLFLKLIEPLIYQTTTDFLTIERVSETRDRIQEKLQRRGRPGTNVKLARGGIRDIEFLVQCLQRLYGGRDPWVRSGGTLFALHRLRDKGYLSMPDFARLSAAYQYLRALEHRLQLDENRQTHTLPEEDEALRLLAAKMQHPAPSGSRPVDLVQRIHRHLQRVSEIYDRVVYAQKPIAKPAAFVVAEASTATVEELDQRPAAEHSWQVQLRHIERQSPSLAAAIRRLPMRWGTKYFEHLLNKLISNPVLLGEFEKSQALLECVGDLMEHSPYLAEHLIRHPKDIRHLKAIVEPSEDGDAPGGSFEDTLTEGTRAGDGGIGDVGPTTTSWDDRPEVRQVLETPGGLDEKSAWLRRFYRHEMLRILGAGIHLRQGIFHTLDRTSRLADWVIRAAYRFAAEDVFGGALPDSPRARMHVIALGRLGPREFDLGSDADLVFVLPAPAAGERRRWTQVAERLIEITSSYTREGIIFAVDARLRPRGRDGELVQTEAQYESYLDGKAEAWEAIAYMKARAVAGDIESGTRFLSKLQDTDWRRYGRSGDLSQLLTAMRQRIENEQGASRPIKSGSGGYYDIDFILMYLRLREAYRFFESLNTPERIRVIHAGGHLSDEQADKLHRTAVFYRSLDHAMRMLSGHSLGKIPSSRSQQQIVKELVGRWSMIKPGKESLAAFLGGVQTETRKLFWEVFDGGGRK